jgi:hypothetical protein
MGIALLAPLRRPIEDLVTDEFEVRDYVRQALAGPLAPRKLPERRRDQRHPYPYPIYLTPVGSDGETPAGPSLVVVGKHLSERGLDFYCHEPIPHRRVIASLECGKDSWVGLLLDLTWCRFTRFGWYDNGGRFLRVAPVQPNLARKSA